MSFPRENMKLMTKTDTILLFSVDEDVLILNIVTLMPGENGKSYFIYTGILDRKKNKHCFTLNDISTIDHSEVYRWLDHIETFSVIFPKPLLMLTSLAFYFT